MQLKKSLLALLFGGLGIGITEFVMMGLLEDIARDLSIDISSAGHLVAGYAFGVVIGAHILSVSVVMYPHKSIFFVLMFLFTVFITFTVNILGFTYILILRIIALLLYCACFGCGCL